MFYFYFDVTQRPHYGMRLTSKLHNTNMIFAFLWFSPINKTNFMFKFNKNTDLKIYTNKNTDFVCQNLTISLKVIRLLLINLF